MVITSEEWKYEYSMGNSFCSGPVDGEPEGNRSTRAELFAIASVLRFFAELIKYHAVNTSRTLYIWSDSAVAIKQVQAIKDDISRGKTSRAGW